MSFRHILLAALVGLLPMWLHPRAISRPKSPKPLPFQLDLDRLTARVTPGWLTVTVPWAGSTLGGPLVVTLVDLNDKVKGRSALTLPASHRLPARLRFRFLLPAKLRPDVDLLRLTFRHQGRLGGRGGRFTTSGRIALSEPLSRYRIWVRGQENLLIGATAALRVVVRDKKGRDVAGVRVRAALHQGQSVARARGRCDGQGNVVLPLRVTHAFRDTRAELRVTTGPGFVHRIRQKVTLYREYDAQLFTDKPVYQPGQQVWARLLLLRRPDRRPVAKAPVVLEVTRPKNRRVLRRVLRTDAFGVAWTRFRVGRRKPPKQLRLRARVKLGPGEPIWATRFVSVIPARKNRSVTRRGVVVTRPPPFQMSVVPEVGKLVPGLEQRVFVTRKKATGPLTGAAVTAKVAPNRNATPLQFDARGVAMLTLKPRKRRVSLTFVATTAGQRPVKASNVLFARQKTPGLLLRAKKPVIRARDPLDLEVRSTQQQGIVYLDVQRHGQTILTRSVRLKRGRARLRLALDPRVDGQVTLAGYLLLRKKGYLTSEVNVILQPRRRLRVAVTMDPKHLRPGRRARLRFKVTDEDGRSRPAVLGVRVVDRAVARLPGMRPLDRWAPFVMPEQGLRELRLERQGGLQASQLLQGFSPRTDDRTARVLLARYGNSATHDVSLLGPDNHATYRQGLARRLKKGLSGRMRGLLHRYRAAFDRYWWQKSTQRRCVEPPTLVSLQQLVKGGGLGRSAVIDPWGGALTWTSHQSFCYRTPHIDVTLRSNGPDGKPRTDDDLCFGPYQLPRPQPPPGLPACGLRGCGFSSSHSSSHGARCGGCGFGGWGWGWPRRTSRLPSRESLLVRPALRTDRQGRAVIRLRLPRTPGRWVVLVSASDRTGRLGGAVQALNVTR